MGPKNKTDQFFREKLDQMEFQPSEQGWEKVQGAINTTSADYWKLYLKVAAGFALILTLGILFYPKQVTTRNTISEITSPQPLEIASIEVKAIEKTVAQEIPSKALVAQKTPEEKVNKSVYETVQSEREPLELARIDEIIITDKIVPVEKLALNEEVDQPAVKITYFTGRSTETPGESVDSVKVSLFDKMKFFARNVSPVELITDIRMAKEDFIENGFKRNE